MYDIQKLRTHFPTTTVFKDRSVTATFKNAKIPAFLRDWILKRKAGADGRIGDLQQLSEYIGRIIPKHDARSAIVDEARTNGESRQFLAKIEVAFNSRGNFYTFELANLGFTHNITIIEDYVWVRIKDQLKGGVGGWGLIKLGYMPPEGNKNNGRFTLLDYKNFCPYEVSVDAYCEARKDFLVEEWMDILLGAIDYNPDSFERQGFIPEDVWEAKHAMLTRLLPFIQARVNLIELAPQETGKSYIFGEIGKYGWLAGGGSLSRAKLFYDIASKRMGIVASNDYVAVDEIKSIEFNDEKEMQGILKGYMENGHVNVANVKVEGDAGIILLGNIDVSDMDATKDMFRELPSVFRDSALLQRFHGFILGKNIPSLTGNSPMEGWALNTEYFTEIMHLMRGTEETLRYRGLVEKLVFYPKGSAGKRDADAVLGLCTAYLKLFFPHADEEIIRDNSFRMDFQKYCLRPAVRMRDVVVKQMQIINSNEFKNKGMVTFRLAEL